MADDSWFRMSGVSRAGKYALCHLSASSLALLFGINSAADYAHLPWLFLGFPLMWLPWLLPDLAVHWPVLVRLLLFLWLMTVNSYTWGHAAAWGHCRIGKVLARRVADGEPLEKFSK